MGRRQGGAGEASPLCFFPRVQSEDASPTSHGRRPIFILFRGQDTRLEGGSEVHWGEGTTSSSDGQRFRTGGGGAETSGGQAIPNSGAVADEMITAITICDRQS